MSETIFESAGSVLTWTAFAAGVLVLVALLGFIGERSATAILTRAGEMKLLAQFVIWRYRRGAHPDLAEHIEARDRAEGNATALRWQVEEWERNIEEAIENLRESQPNHVITREWFPKLLKDMRERRAKWEVEG